MIKTLNIKNFKSIVDIKMPLSRFNVIIGENGCGKSNILEAIAFAASASVDKMDVLSMEGRGIRVTSPRFMQAAFEETDNDDIFIKIDTFKSEAVEFSLFYNTDTKPAQWEERRHYLASNSFNDLEGREHFDAILEQIKMHFYLTKDTSGNIRIEPKFNIIPELASFIIYSLSENELRRFDNPSNNMLRKDGTGLFSYLKQLAQTEQGKVSLHEIRKNMEILDWFDSMEIPENVISTDNTIHLKDRYIDETLSYFDQRSANEAFLYLLFYFTLFISEETPSFFAIDNIESSLNPKLCRVFTQRIIELAEKYDKQVIVTTHSPYVLDGLDIDKDSQRLFVVRRNIDGHTIINQVKKNNEKDIPLSEAWMKGYLGGLPNNF